jgi:transcriptional regulator with XRE-family HTH domain
MATSLAELIKEARESKNMTQAAVNKHLKAGSMLCSDIERGKSNGKKHLERLCSLLSIDLEQAKQLAAQTSGTKGKAKKPKTYQLKDKELPLKAKRGTRTKTIEQIANKAEVRTASLPLTDVRSFEAALTEEIMGIVKQRVKSRISALWS